MSGSGRGDNGIMIGIVTSLEDKEDHGRIQVKYPTQKDQKSDWARLVSQMAGNERGMFFRPEVGDEVLVAFEHGDPRRPYILGSMWSETDKRPKDDGNNKENNWRFIRSRSGHVVKLDDTKGKEKIEIIDKDEKRRIVIDTSEQKIRIASDGGDVEIKVSSGNVSVDASGNITMKAQGSISIEANGTLTLKGSKVEIN